MMNEHEMWVGAKHYRGVGVAAHGAACHSDLPLHYTVCCWNCRCTAQYQTRIALFRIISSCKNGFWFLWHLVGVSLAYGVASSSGLCSAF